MSSDFQEATREAGLPPVQTIAREPSTGFHAQAMAVRKAPKQPAAWTFGRKLSLWLADRNQSLNAFAKSLGVPQSTMHGWVRQGIKVSPEGLRKIAAATGLSAGYWLSEATPYPPPAEVLDVEAEVQQAIQALTPDQLIAILEMLQDPDDLRRTLALRKAAR